MKGQLLFFFSFFFTSSDLGLSLSSHALIACFNSCPASLHSVYTLFTSCSCLENVLTFISRCVVAVIFCLRLSHRTPSNFLHLPSVPSFVSMPFRQPSPTIPQNAHGSNFSLHLEENYSISLLENTRVTCRGSQRLKRRFFFMDTFGICGNVQPYVYFNGSTVIVSSIITVGIIILFYPISLYILYFLIFISYILSSIRGIILYYIYR